MSNMGPGNRNPPGDMAPDEPIRLPRNRVEEHEVHERLFGVTIDRGEAKFVVAVVASKIDGTCSLHFECEWSDPNLNPDEAEIMADALRAAILLMKA